MDDGRLMSDGAGIHWLCDVVFGEAGGGLLLSYVHWGWGGVLDEDLRRLFLHQIEGIAVLQVLL